MTDRHHDQSQSGKQVVKKLFFFFNGENVRKRYTYRRIGCQEEFMFFYLLSKARYMQT